MTQQVVKIGKLPNDGTGDPLRIAFSKIDDNFTELYYIFTSPVSQLVAGDNIILDPPDGEVVVTMTALQECDDDLVVDGGNTSNVQPGNMIIDGGEAYVCT